MRNPKQPPLLSTCSTSPCEILKLGRSVRVWNVVVVNGFIPRLPPRPQISKSPVQLRQTRRDQETMPLNSMRCLIHCHKYASDPIPRWHWDTWITTKKNKTNRGETNHGKINITNKPDWNYSDCKTKDCFCRTCRAASSRGASLVVGMDMTLCGRMSYVSA